MLDMHSLTASYPSVHFAVCSVTITDFGLVTLICSAIHSITHVVRFVYESESEQLYRANVNRSGLVALLLLLPTAVPMSIGFLKEKVRCNQ